MNEQGFLDVHGVDFSQGFDDETDAAGNDTNDGERELVVENQCGNCEYNKHIEYCQTSN